MLRIFEDHVSLDQIVFTRRLACTFNANVLLAQFLGLSSEVYATSEYGTTYHIYAHFGSPSDEVLAVYSIGQEEEGSVDLNLEVTTSFFQETILGVNLGSDLFGSLLAMFPDAAYDSWLTIGSTSNADAQVSSIGMSGAFIDFNTGTGFTLDGAVGGSWYVTPGSNPLAMAGENGKVLLAQLTAADGVDGAGHVICDWNLHWIDDNGNGHYEEGLLLNTQNPAEYEFSQYTSPLFVFPSGGDFDLTGYLKHLVSVNTVFEDDFIHKIYGSADLNAAINVPEGMYNDYFGGATAGSSPCINEYILSNHTLRLVGRHWAVMRSFFHFE